MARSDLELGYRLLEECIHGGRVSGRQLAQMMRGDPKFAEWLRARASARSKAPTFSERLAATFSTQATTASSGSLVAEYTSLISLAAWLHFLLSPRIQRSGSCRGRDWGCASRPGFRGRQRSC